MLLVHLTPPDRLDGLGAEGAIHLADAHNDSDLVTIRRMREVERLHDAANFNSVFVFHKRIIAKTPEKGNSKNPNRINNLRMRLEPHARLLQRSYFGAGDSLG